MKKITFKLVSLFIVAALLFSAVTMNSVSAASASVACSYPNDYGYIWGIDSENNSLTTFSAAFTGDAGNQLSVKDYSGKELTGGDLVGNAAVVTVSNNSILVKNYKVVLLGDNNCDGKINAIDLLQLKRHVLKLTTLTGDQAVASNVNQDVNGINAFDLLAVKKHILKMVILQQNYIDYNDKTITMADSTKYVRTLGRTIATGTYFTLDWTCTGIEFVLNCEGDVALNYGWSGATGMIAVIINDDEANAKQYSLTSIGMGQVKIATALPRGNYKFKVIKLTEAYTAQANFYSLKFTGSFDVKPLEKQLKLEFYGDSITCGYGNMCPTRSLSGLIFGNYEDGNNTYATITAKNLNADVSVNAISGWGLVIGYGNQVSCYLPKVWDYSLPKSNPGLKWDFSQYIPDVVVVNLSTNDSSVYNNASSAGKPTKPEFQAAAVTFLQNIRAKYPNAHIIWANGLMGTGVFTNEIKAAQAACNDSKMSYIELPYNGDAGDWHPSINGHKAAATVLTTEIKRILNID